MQGLTLRQAASVDAWPRIRILQEAGAWPGLRYVGPRNISY
jgi:hypothetical protein